MFLTFLAPWLLFPGKLRSLGQVLLIVNFSTSSSQVIFKSISQVIFKSYSQVIFKSLSQVLGLVLISGQIWTCVVKGKNFWIFLCRASSNLQSEVWPKTRIGLLGQFQNNLQHLHKTEHWEGDFSQTFKIQNYKISKSTSAPPSQNNVIFKIFKIQTTRLLKIICTAFTKLYSGHDSTCFLEGGCWSVGEPQVSRQPHLPPLVQEVLWQSVQGKGVQELKKSHAIFWRKKFTCCSQWQKQQHTKNIWFFSNPNWKREKYDAVRARGSAQLVLGKLGPEAQLSGPNLPRPA